MSMGIITEISLDKIVNQKVMLLDMVLMYGVKNDTLKITISKR